MRILAFDASGATPSIALWQDGEILSEFRDPTRLDQNDSLLSQIERLTREHNWDFKSLNLLATTRGPGSFTGIRVGLSAARGLSLVHNTPIIAISATRLIERLHPVEARAGLDLLVALESKREELWVQFFQDGQNSAPEALTLAEISSRHASPLLVAGDAAAKIVDARPDCRLSRRGSPLSAADLAHAAYQLWLHGGGEPLEPLYIRPPLTTTTKVG